MSPYDVKSITYLKNNAAELLRTIERDRRTVAITQNGVAKAVVLDVETYDRWRKAMAMLKLIALGQADIGAGRLVSHGDALARAEAAIEAAGDVE